MQRNTVTKLSGGKIRPTSMIVAAPETYLAPKTLHLFAAGSYINGEVLLDLLSSFCTHERGSVRLYKSLVERTRNHVWREKYREFLEETQVQGHLLERVIMHLGGDPMYVSPMARLTELQNTRLTDHALLFGSFDTTTRKLAELEAVIQAEHESYSNWAFLSTLVSEMRDTKYRHLLWNAVCRIEPRRDKHIHWALVTWQELMMSLLTDSD